MADADRYFDKLQILLEKIDIILFIALIWKKYLFDLSVDYILIKQMTYIYEKSERNYAN